MGGYAELHCKSNFSFLCAASHPEELVRRAADLNYHAIAITDQNSLAGVVCAYEAARDTKLKLLIGAEIMPLDAPPVLLYAMNFAGYRKLAHLLTVGRRAAVKGDCHLTFRDVAEHSDNVIAMMLDFHAPYREVLGDRCYLTTAMHIGPDDELKLQRALQTSHTSGVPLVATNDVHYHTADRRRLHDVVTAIKHGTTVANLGTLRFANGERYLKSHEQMAKLFASCPEAIVRTVEIADRCHFCLSELRYEYPEELCPAGMSPTQHLANLAWAGAQSRYPSGLPDKVRVLLERELALIAELQYEAYFLTVWDLVNFARSRGILCQGRGSAANSAVCYCLGITSVDPDKSDLLFERFISRERNEAPDIDVDFEHERREEVFQYIYGKYGRDRAAIVAEVISYRPRSAVRDVGKALGLSLDSVNRLSKVLDPYAEAANIAQRIREAGLDPEAPSVNHLVELSTTLLGFPRHLSQHVGGFVITRGLLSELVPIENAAMPERTVIEWDKYDLDTLGILKVDCLSLGMLTAIRKSFDLIDTRSAVGDGQKLTLATVPAEDPAVYDMICKADTVGVFQIESRAQMSMLPRLQPRCFYDLVIEVAIVRPGPIQGGMVHPFLRRRNGEEPVTYPSPLVEEVLKRTLGVPLFQEQVMRLAVVAAGFSPGEADQLRRAMGGWRKSSLIDGFRQKLLEGMTERGLSTEFAQQVFEQIRGFGEYGFPEAHAASFALLAYVSAWLKCHHPVEFTTALLNSQPMGFYAPAQIVRDLLEHGHEVRAVDVNRSGWDCTLEEGESKSPCMRLGFRLISGFPEATGRAVEAARAEAPFGSISDLARRLHLSRALLARLAAADAFGSLNLDRRSALWYVLALGEELPLFAEMDEPEAPPPFLTKMSTAQDVKTDYETIGLSLKAHPISLVRPELDRLNVLAAAALQEKEDKSTVRTAGLVLMRQQPSTAKGTIFMTLEDETGIVNLVIWSRTWQRFRAIARNATALVVEGKLERASGVTHLIVANMEDLSDSLRGLHAPSRDFH